MELHLCAFGTVWDLWWDIWPHVLGFLGFVMALLSSAHAVLYKRDARASIGWVGVIWLVPFLGATLYLLLGINRIRRKAFRRRGRGPLLEPSLAENVAGAQDVLQALTPEGSHLTTLVKLVADVTGRPLLRGNRVAPLISGDEAYPAMLEAIDEAKVSVSLATYIFGNDQVGQQFIDALTRAVQRGVEVRVMIDDIGSRYNFPSVFGTIRRAGIPVEKFMRQAIPGWFPYSNLRNHRKILVVDGRVAFTGGLNINAGAILKLNPQHPIQDLHFRITGPVVGHLQQVFVDDWAFCHGEVLSGDAWFPKLVADGDVLARGITYGPDEDLGKMRLTLLGALACAQLRVAIVTPYFLPDEALSSALNVAAMRGVEVDIILPRANNLSLVKWASTAMLWQVLEHGCRVWLSPPPFDHTKLMVVDNSWSLIGSGNWDPRSLRLNFEFNVECYGRELATMLDGLVQERLRVSQQVTLADVDGRPLPIKLRDGVARLFSPYL